MRDSFYQALFELLSKFGGFVWLMRMLDAHNGVAIATQLSEFGKIVQEKHVFVQKKWTILRMH